MVCLISGQVDFQLYIKWGRRVWEYMSFAFFSNFAIKKGCINEISCNVLCIYDHWWMLRCVLLLCRSCLIIYTQFWGSRTIRRLSRSTSETMTTVPCPVRDTCPTSINTSWTRYTSLLYILIHCSSHFVLRPRLLCHSVQGNMLVHFYEGMHVPPALRISAFSIWHSS